MPEIKYHGKGPVERIHDRLKPSCADYGKFEPLMANVSTETNPTRTVHGIRHGGSVQMHGPKKGGEK
jgi:hypothetical protein